MPQPWGYGSHGLPASGGHHSQTGAPTMHHHRYHHGAAPGPAAGMDNAASYTAHRGSPTMNNRPPSSASTSSASSYHTVASGPVPLLQGSNSAAIHHPMPMGVGPSQGHLGHGLHSGIPHHHMPTARYPMPPRNGGGHPMAHGGHMPMRPFHHGVPPAPTSQPLRQLSGGNTPQMAGSTSPSYGPLKQPAGGMGQAGNPPLHHPVPYRHHPRMHAMGGGPPNGPPAHHYQYHHQHHQGYHHGPRRSSYPPSTPQYPMGAQQHHEAKYTHYQRPMYESPETVDHSLRGSPSPPPPPPFAEGREGAANTPNSPAQPSRSVQERRTSGDASVLKNSLKNVHLSEENDAAESVGANTSSKKVPVTEDDDAASILLQLSGVPSQSGGPEGENGENEIRPMSTIHGLKSESFATQSSAGLLKPIESSLSMDDDTTIATADGADYAPDLTSEPSSDSIDQNDSEFPAWVPDNYPTRLAMKYDDTKLNSLHCFLRSELLEIFVVQKSSHKSPTHSPGSSVGRVGLRCVHCAMVRKQKENRDEAPMAVFYPKSIAEIYRLVTSWQRCHLRKCRHLPPSVRAKWVSLRETDKSRGKTHYWITSAKELGLIDCQSRAGGIRFGPNTKGSEAGAQPQEPASTSVEAGPTAPTSEPAPQPKVAKEPLELSSSAPKPDVTTEANAATATVV